MNTHASDKRLIFGSVVLSALSEDGAEISIRHFVIHGSSQWVTGSNITRKCDIKHKEGHYVELPIRTKVNTPDFIALIE